MTSTVVLTDDIRLIPYFSDFPSSDMIIEIPREGINEAINYGDVSLLSLQQMTIIGENRIYLGLDVDEIVKEIIWIVNDPTYNQNISIPPALSTQINFYYSKKDSQYIYGIRNKIVIDKNTCGRIATGGNLRLLKWVKSLNGHWDKWTCCAAAYNGHYDFLKYAIENGCPIDIDVIRYGVMSDKILIVKYLREQSVPWNESVCECALSLEVLKYLHENGCRWNENLQRNNASSNRLDMLKYAHENGCPWNESICAAAAYNCHLDALIYARESKCAWNYLVCKNAAIVGNLDILRYAHENGCPWNEDVLKVAAKYGNIPILEYALNNGCISDESLYEYTLYLPVYQYLYSRNHPLTISTFNYAARSGVVKLLKYLRNKCPWGSGTGESAAFAGKIDSLKYLDKHGCPKSNRICSIAANNGDLKMLRYAHENGYYWNEEVILKAIKNNHLAMISYALNNKCPMTLVSCKHATECKSDTIIALIHLHNPQCNNPSCTYRYKFYNYKFCVLM